MASIPSTGHIRKRLFQPSISSYFNNRHVDPTSPSQRTTSPFSPPLPAETQASLLSVGMRVRKSVPEGYKTHKTLGTPGFPFPSAPPPTSTAPAQSGYSSVGPRELTPFCGLHKTGGWAAQPVPPSSAPAAMQRDDESEHEDDAPTLTMSQNTLASTQNSFLSSASAQSAEGSRKRTYEEEIEDDLDGYFDEIEATDLAEQQVPQIGRPMARLKQSAVKAAPDGMVRVFGEDDFEDAAFLAPADGMDVDGA